MAGSEASEGAFVLTFFTCLRCFTCVQHNSNSRWLRPWPAKPSLDTLCWCLVPATYG